MYHHTECPVSDEDDYRIEVLISLRRLERLDKDEYTDDERQEAEEVSSTNYILYLPRFRIQSRGNDWKYFSRKIFYCSSYKTYNKACICSRI